MPPIGMIIVFSWIILVGFVFVISFLLTQFYGIKFTKYVKTKSIKAWEEATNKIDWVGIQLPRVVCQISPAMISKQFNEEHSDDSVYLRLKKLAIKTKKLFFISFGVCIMSIIVGILILIVLH